MAFGRSTLQLQTCMHTCRVITAVTTGSVTYTCNYDIIYDDVINNIKIIYVHCIRKIICYVTAVCSLTAVVSLSLGGWFNSLARLNLCPTREKVTKSKFSYHTTCVVNISLQYTAKQSYQQWTLLNMASTEMGRYRLQEYQ